MLLLMPSCLRRFWLAVLFLSLSSPAVADGSAHIIIGLPKTGTTHLWNCMTSAFRSNNVTWGEKEKFAFGSGLDPPAARRAKQRRLASARYFDFTPNYLLTPGARDELHRALPHARLGLLVRDPWDRAYSNWRMMRAWQWETSNRTFADVAKRQLARLCGCEPLLCTREPSDLLRIEQRGRVLRRCFLRSFQAYVHYSLPALGLLHWLEKFPAGQVTVLRYSTLQAMPASGLVRFLEQFTGLAADADAESAAACDPASRDKAFSGAGEHRGADGDWQPVRAHLRAVDATDFVLAQTPGLTVV